MSERRHREHSRARALVSWSLITFALVLITLAGWIRFHFGEVSFEQILNNLPIAGGKGVGNNDLAIEAVAVCIGGPLVVVSLAALGLRLLRRRGVRPRRLRLVPSLSVAVSLSVLLSVAGIPQYAIAQLYDQSIAAYYLTPTITSAPAKPKNLITIYLESAENTFGEAEVVGENLLANLDSATQGWTNYQGLEQYEGGGWTMAGLVGTQCGIPLKSKLLAGSISLNEFGEEVTEYLPGATCLGDLLATQGYVNAFVGGADEDFAGKNTFLASHGYTKTYGLSNWKAAGESSANITEWGLSDSRMLAHAADTLDALSKGSRPFSLTMLTLDTHEPPGVFADCDTHDRVKMATAIKCSTKAVARFLDYAKQAGYLDNTVVILMGDHLKGTGDVDTFGAALARVDQRSVLYRVWSPDPVQIHRSRADQLSVLPTTLELLGFGTPDGRAGLGVSFIGAHDLAETALTLDEKSYHALLNGPSTKIYQQFWRSG